MNSLYIYFNFCFQALIKFLAEAHRGIHGFVIDENGNPIERASIKVKSRDVSFLTTKYGEFWRILLPGVYKLEVILILDTNKKNNIYNIINILNIFKLTKFIKNLNLLK